jgi:hypothetical protein
MKLRAGSFNCRRCDGRGRELQQGAIPIENQDMRLPRAGLEGTEGHSKAATIERVGGVFDGHLFGVVG